ncbi:hypothetical protein AB0L82_35850 [Nocardia sp. NPDC052001]|uniref:deazapurine DNA modification protein DpdA family protein n=1 Tax=Nocardia sp. NPDC052001 TaxID=3154853 RepID=UPI0034195BB2
MTSGPLTPTAELRFLLGTHQPHWLTDFAVPLFVSDRRLRERTTLPRAYSEWALDSGGFTELSDYGGWETTTPAEYAARVRRYRDEIGSLSWAAPQDWMCEPAILAGGQVEGRTFVGTKLTVPEHQRRTVENFLTLRELAPDLPFIPVLQGWQVSDYLRCAAQYFARGVDLLAAPVVGVGSVCRRQASREAAEIFAVLVDEYPGIRLHGFGVKAEGLGMYGSLLRSADSMAWSKAALYDAPLPGCAHKSCSNCPRYAMRWRDQVLTAAAEHARHPRGIQMSLLFAAA